MTHDTKHTKTPWRVAEAWQFPDDAGRVFDAVVKRFKNGTESLVCSFEHSVFRESQKANVEFIVRAVNAHDGLVKAAKRFAQRTDALFTTDDLEYTEAHEELWAALAKAGEKE